MEETNQYFSQLYDQYITRIYRFVYLKVSSVETAEDLSSEVFLRLYKRLREPGREIQNPQAFLYQIARNVVADHYRGRRVTTISIEKTTIEIEDIGDPTQGQAEVNLEMDRIRQALSQLQDDYQNLIIWRYIDELTVPEIAQIIGKSEGNIRVGVSRALEALREKIT
ncbi:MAG: hypothetical protein A3D64_01190 [Candidatus Wildermuthbacteria bacterium RIFCSPHIGHO2_02_FULL_49_9]|uniref:RNA polymerase subunit sigma-24 n=2 Tax=Candidatus Wildermuthiibacteriota TaxID=1817923 RepID=A0A1G2R0Y4_9BACT|nr:MAG: hypothetical protein A2672_00205 [Candidatus Wildermuthbacteria bacterium RIFCSPHIGHO2_01_FULL_49_22b]OHA70622.1 MAG: hypothetical protein A3D64_01190 [Candidatus Wildermuthbacteria bacterium RIFCSPHIGHO2_02_FULL_49_9]